MSARNRATGAASRNSWPSRCKVSARAARERPTIRVAGAPSSRTGVTSTRQVPRSPGIDLDVFAELAHRSAGQRRQRPGLRHGDRAVGTHELSDRRAAADVLVDQAVACLADVVGRFGDLRAQVLVDAREHRAADAEVDEEAHRGERRAHRGRERQRQTQPHRQPAHARSAVGAQPVADPANRLERLAVERPVDLLAQVADVDVDDVRPALERHVPGAVEQLDAGEHDARAAA